MSTQKRVIYKNGSNITREVTWEYENDEGWLCTLPDSPELDKVCHYLGETCANEINAEKLIKELEIDKASKDAEIQMLRTALKSIASGCYTRETSVAIAITALEER